MGGPLDGPLASLTPPEREDLKARAIEWAEGAVEDFQLPFAVQLVWSGTQPQPFDPAVMTDAQVIRIMHALRDFAAAGYLRGYAQAIDDGANVKARKMGRGRVRK